MAAEEVSPDFSEMILAAITALNDENRSSKSAILKYIETEYQHLPEDHETLLADHLNAMKEKGQIVMINSNYMHPSADAPLKRGRGRPPKTKIPVTPPTGLVFPAGPPRPRGRPPKLRDPNAPPSPVVAPASPRPRGRPPKRAKLNTSGEGGSKRPRGRPPKAKTPEI